MGELRVLCVNATILNSNLLLHSFWVVSPRSNERVDIAATTIYIEIKS
jgi:hypothetical protein